MPFPSIRRACLPLALFAALSGCGTARLPEPPMAPALASVLDAQVAPGYNGAVLVRPSRSNPALVRAFGAARFEDPAKAAPDDRFMVGSVSR